MTDIVLYGHIPQALHLYLTIRPQGRMDYKSIAHEAVGRMDYLNS